jgi:hypothetical protein
LSAVGAAFSVGAGAVCACAPALKLKMATIAATAVSGREFAFRDQVVRPIAVSLFSKMLEREVLQRNALA